VGCESDRSSVLCASITSSWYDCQTFIHLLPTFLLMARARARCSAPVISEVSPNTPWMPIGMSLSYMLPTVGQDASPVVVSLSPHLVETHSSEMSHCSRLSSDAICTYCLATYDAFATVAMSPCPSMPKPVTGLPVFLMPSTTRLVQPSS